jgi:hypothetical protein
MYPIQIPLIVVFIRLGESMLGVAPIPFSATLMMAELRANPALLVERFGTAGLHGILGWAMVAPVVVGLTYAALVPILRVASRRPANARPHRQPLRAGRPGRGQWTVGSEGPAGRARSSCRKSRTESSRR